MSWLKDVYQAGKAREDELRARNEAIEAIYLEHDPMVRRLLQDAADLLWGPQGLFPKADAKPTYENHTWIISLYASTVSDSCTVTITPSGSWASPMWDRAHFSVRCRTTSDSSFDAESKDLTEEELKNALKLALNSLVRRG